MPTTAWRFSGTEGADEAVLKLKQLEAAKLIEGQDVTVIRWPQYAADPMVREHVTHEGNKVSSLVLLTPDAAIEAVVKAFDEQGAELIRSDLSVQDEDRLRAAAGGSADTDRPWPPGNTRRPSTYRQ